MNNDECLLLFLQHIDLVLKKAGHKNSLTEDVYILLWVPKLWVKPGETLPVINCIIKYSFYLPCHSNNVVAILRNKMPS